VDFQARGISKQIRAEYEWESHGFAIMIDTAIGNDCGRRRKRRIAELRKFRKFRTFCNPPRFPHHRHEEDKPTSNP
jgi:hypothetical protein